MGWFKKLISGSLSKIIKELGEAIDKNVTNDEERLELRNALAQIGLNAELESERIALQYEQELSKRHQADMMSDDVYSKRIRPLAVAYLLFVISILAVSDGNFHWNEMQFTIQPEYITLFQSLLMTAFMFYFGGRSVEKVAKIISDWKKPAAPK